MSLYDVETAVVGGGVVGCAVAQALARRGKSVVLLEAGPRLAEGVTSRNSGVIHSGLYYPPRSLKAESCIRGNALLYAWARQHNVWHRKCGKLVVAQNAEQVVALEHLALNARDAGAPGCELVTSEFVKSLEPTINAVAALWCPETGIVDATELTQSLAGATQSEGAVVLTHARVTSIQSTGSTWQLETARGPVSCVRVVNCAGLHADDVATMAGAGHYTIHPCRGDYFRLRSSVRYGHLIYPVKEKRSAGLGVHLTLDRSGGYRLGPDVQYVSSKEDFTSMEHKRDAFHAAAVKLLGPLNPEQLTYDSCGIRPKLRAPHQSEEKDFVLQEDRPGFINLVGIESPGLTAALDLADRVMRMCQ